MVSNQKIIIVKLLVRSYFSTGRGSRRARLFYIFHVCATILSLGNLLQRAELGARAFSEEPAQEDSGRGLRGPLVRDEDFPGLVSLKREPSDPWVVHVLAPAM